MKKGILTSLIALFAIVIAFTTSINAQTTTKKTTKSSPIKTSDIDLAKSYIGWIGKKIVGQHNGKVKLESGSVTTKAGILTGGNFTIDMKSITCDDLTDANYNDKLIGHLNSSDFFNVTEYPTATLKITKVLKYTKKVNSYNLTADLTIKGITKSITFPATFKMVGNKFEGVAKITIDRTLWDIKYGSSNFFEGLGDKAIKNEIELSVVLATN